MTTTDTSTTNTSITDTSTTHVPATDTSSTDTLTSTDHRAVVDGYFDCWNTTDPAERVAAVQRVYTPEAHLVDPLVDVIGHDALVELFANFHVTYAGHSFRRSGGIDAHHNLVRWGWEMVDADGNVVLDGIDAALLADDGRISFVAGFFGAALPAV
ncbi:MAG: nuclear transport factor 2 family protein [Ilumatobacteraceae bacterium]